MAKITRLKSGITIITHWKVDFSTDVGAEIQYISENGMQTYDR